jgi:hypothetical protein
MVYARKDIVTFPAPICKKLAQDLVGRDLRESLL